MVRVRYGRGRVWKGLGREGVEYGRGRDRAEVGMGGAGVGGVG